MRTCFITSYCCTAGNEATKRFLIDTTLPVIEGVKDFGYYKDSVVITAKDLGSGVKLVLLDGENVTNSAAITCYEAGSHTVYVEPSSLQEILLPENTSPSKVTVLT